MEFKPRYQAQLQKNLLYLAAIADAQPPTSSVRPQMVPHPAMQQGGPFGQQASAFPPRPPMQFNMQQIHEQQQQQRQPQLMPFPGHMGMRPGVMNGMPSMHAQTSHVGGNELLPGSGMAELPRGSTPASISREGESSKQDTGKLTAADTAQTTDGRSSGAEHGSGEVAKSS